MIKGVDYFETYAPVVSWTTVRLVMTLAVNLGLKSKQVDYNNAFVQAELKPGEEVYMEFPRGHKQEGKVLKLTKSVYGLANAPLNWFKHLSEGLNECGLQPSSFDPCLFLSPKVLCVVYVDDCLF